MVCEGDGISFMQKLYGARSDRFVHPILPFRHTLKVLIDSPILGRFAGQRSYVIACSAGCPMGCDYCPASSFYGKKRITYLGGKRLFAIMRELKKETPDAGFFLWDQDFLMDRERYRTFGQAVKRYNENRGEEGGMLDWSSQVSIHTLSKVDLDELADFGCRFLAIGIEMSSEKYAKRRGAIPRRCSKNSNAGVLAPSPFSSSAGRRRISRASIGRWTICLFSESLRKFGPFPRFCGRFKKFQTGVYRMHINNSWASATC